MFYAMRVVFGALSGLWLFTWLFSDKPVEVKFQQAILFLKTLAEKILLLANYIHDLIK